MMKRPIEFSYRSVTLSFTQFLRLGVLVSVVTLLPALESLNFSASADIVEGYVPPGPPSSQRTQGSGSRGGCSGYTNTKFRLLAPNDHVAVTVSDPPSVFAYVSQGDVPFTITLVEPGIPHPLYEKNLKSTRSGILKIELPKEKPLKMKQGHQYRWTLSLLCNKRRFSENPYAQVNFKYVNSSPALQRELKSNWNKRAQIYARAGIWYDALAHSKASEADYFAQLLQQIGVSEEVKDMQVQQFENEEDVVVNR